MEYSSNIPLASLFIVTNLPLNLLTIIQIYLNLLRSTDNFHLLICLLSPKDLLPNQYLKCHYNQP